MNPDQTGPKRVFILFAIKATNLQQTREQTTNFMNGGKGANASHRTILTAINESNWNILYIVPLVSFKPATPPSRD